MKFDVENLAATKKRLKVEVSSEEVDAALDRAYSELNRSVKVEGFRPGHAPRALLEKRYSKSVHAEVLERLVPEVYFKAVEQAGLVPVERPNFEGGELSIKKGEPLIFVASLDVKPEFELADYKTLEVKDEPVVVTDEELDAAIKDLREMHSTLETVEEDRPSVTDDHLVIDFEGIVDDKPLAGGKGENYPLQLGSGSFIPGFEEQLTGVKKGDAIDVKVKFPEDYKYKEVAGKDALFKVVVKEIKKKVLPEVDDEFAKDLRLGDTLAELRDKLREDIALYKKKDVVAHQKHQIMQELEKRNQGFELPASMVEKELRGLMMRAQQEQMRSGKNADEIDLKALEAEFRPNAETRVRVTLILGQIAVKEGVRVTDQELESGLKRIAAESGYSSQALHDLYQRRDGSLEGLRSTLGEDKVLDLLLSRAAKS